MTTLLQSYKAVARLLQPEISIWVAALQCNLNVTVVAHTHGYPFLQPKCYTLLAVLMVQQTMGSSSISYDTGNSAFLDTLYTLDT